MITPQPTKEQLEESITKHVAHSREIVKKIPWDKRTILSRSELKEYLRFRLSKEIICQPIQQNP